MALPYSPTEVGLPLTLQTERLPQPNARLETTGGRPKRQSRLLPQPGGFEGVGAGRL
jgi:hypothetical protein